MTQTHRTRPHSTTANPNAQRRRGETVSSSRSRSLGLAYDGVMAAYIRDISESHRRLADGKQEA